MLLREGQSRMHGRVESGRLIERKSTRMYRIANSLCILALIQVYSV